MNYLKELISDIWFSIKRGFQTMRGTFRANRRMSRTVKKHHKLVKVMGHCGAFLNEIEQSIEMVDDEQQLKCVNEFIEWADTITEDYEDITPKQEEEWKDVLAYKFALEQRGERNENN
tara:strand:+ start:38 stop:391 length:354 start_codon:yes stop_codon:yes gene_type:complete